jgi:hypothetical protein
MKIAVLLASVLLFLAATSETSAQTILRASSTQESYAQLKSFLGSDNAVEVPDCAHAVAHITHGNDGILNRHVFYFHSHVNQDNDRCMNYDRQRTEITTYQSKFYGGHGETVSNSWNMKLDANFQWSNTWTDVHQLKAVGGNEKNPIITLQAINNKFQVSHMNGENLTTKLGTTDLGPFLGNWVHIVQEVTYWTGGGHYYIHVTRLDNGQTLLLVDKSNVEMWRPDNSFVRPKWGIYRSLNDKAALRDETIRFDSFCFAKGTEKCT